MKITDLIEDTCVITEQELHEMARVKPTDSGLPFVMFVSDKSYVKGRHGPRIKISNIIGTYSENDNFAVTISKSPIVIAGIPAFNKKIIDDLFDWVILNYDSLMKFWNDEYQSDADFYNELLKL